MAHDPRFAALLLPALRKLGAQADEVMALFARIARISGAENILKDLGSGKTTTRGAIGELRYAAHLVGEGKNVTLLGETYKHPETGQVVKGLDIIIDAGKQVIDFKYYDTSSKNFLTREPDERTSADPKKLEKWREFQAKMLADRVREISVQAQRHAARWPDAELIFAFPRPLSAIPQAIQGAVTAAGGRVVEAPF